MSDSPGGNPPPSYPPPPPPPHGSYYGSTAAGGGVGAGAAAAGAGLGVGMIVVLVLMVPLCIGGVGIVAAIAIPNFIAMQLKAKRAEAPTNLDGIRTAEKAYHHEWDAFYSAGPTPDYVPGRGQTDFSGGGYAAFQNLGWVANGLVRCQYEVMAINSTNSASDDFVAIARCDVDGDGVEAIYQANRAEKATMVTPNNVY